MMNKKDDFLEKEFDFSKAIKNPYTKELKRQVTINLDENVVLFFKKKSNQIGIPYQTLINLYLKDCMNNDKEPKLNWT